MEKMLLLLLGIAINGEFKEKFIEQIQQQLETHTQIHLIPYIQLVTEDVNFSVSKSILFKIDNNAATSTTTNATTNPPIVLLSQSAATVKTTLTLEVNTNVACEPSGETAEVAAEPGNNSNSMNAFALASN